jgi:hypothetical protein
LEYELLDRLLHSVIVAAEVRVSVDEGYRLARVIAGLLYLGECIGVGAWGIGRRCGGGATSEDNCG